MTVYHILNIVFCVTFVTRCQSYIPFILTIFQLLTVGVILAMDGLNKKRNLDRLNASCPSSHTTRFGPSTPLFPFTVNSWTAAFCFTCLRFWRMRAALRKPAAVRLKHFHDSFWFETKLDSNYMVNVTILASIIFYLY